MAALAAGLALASALAATLTQPGDASAARSPTSLAPAINEREAIRIARADPEAKAALRADPGLHLSARRAPDLDWEVGLFDLDDQRVQVVVNSADGTVEESWTGDQVAWRMARGYEGAFGRKLNAPYVWLGLCAVFLAGLFDWRRPWRVAHLDLIVLLGGFGVSQYFFNRGEIGVSVPLAYPPLIYLLARMLWSAARGGQGLRPSAPIGVLAVAALCVLGLRIGMNLSDSTVIDVGYAGVIGADLIADGEPLYGNYPDDNHRGDTYGPVSYYAYLPFEQAIPWSGRADQLPTAHAVTIFFDLFTIGALFLLGRRLRAGPAGTSLGVVLAFGWIANPYTALALQSNSNDGLVAALLVAALLVISSPAARGGILALAAMTKFAPLALAPLFATYRDPPRPPTTRLMTLAPFAAALAATVALVSVQTLIDPGIGVFWERTIGNQAGRDSPFSIWGQVPSLEWLHTAAKIGAVALAGLVAFVPRRRDPITVAALAAAVMIALQLTVEHWFYLYIPWFLPLMLIALLGRWHPPEDGRGVPAWNWLRAP